MSDKELFAPVIRASRNPSYPGAALLVVRCPICGAEHHHGEPQVSTAGYNLGDRAAHCKSRLSFDGPSGYTIIDPDGLVSKIAS